MIRTREEILRDIQQNINLTERFYSWKEEQREEFMDFCTGVKGVKMLYDAFFKEIMNPDDNKTENETQESGRDSGTTEGDNK